MNRVSLGNDFGLVVPTDVGSVPFIRCNRFACEVLEGDFDVPDRLPLLKNAVLGASGISANRMYYPTHVIERAVEEAQERVKAHAMLGEMNHKSSLVGLPPDPAEAAIVVLSLKTVDIPPEVVEQLKTKTTAFTAPEKRFVLIVGDVLFLPTQAGIEAARVIQAGGTLSFSLRGRIVKGREVPRLNAFMVEELELIAFDVVTRGGFGALVENSADKLEFIEVQRVQRLRDNPVEKLLNLVLQGNPV